MKDRNQLLLCSAIVAMSTNRVIGKDNQLPWHLPNDLQRFKAITTGHPIIMGRKTYVSIGRALSNRTNIILTHDNHFVAPGCLIANTLQTALHYAALNGTEEAFIIGGAEIYQLFMPYITRIYLTKVECSIEGEVYFPFFNPLDWREVFSEKHLADERHAYAYQFIQLEKIPT